MRWIALNNSKIREFVQINFNSLSWPHRSVQRSCMIGVWKSL
jgi:hypothetical protein